MPSISAGVQGVERSISRLIADVKKSEAQLRKDVEDLERESNPSYVAAQQSSGIKSTKSIVKIKSEKLEKSKALRLAVQVRGGSGRHCAT